MNEEHTCKIPGEVLYGILASLPARNLLLVRGTSRDFAITIDSLLRTRLREFDENPFTEIVFESSAPSEYRSAGQQTIKLLEFIEPDDSNDLVPKDVARFVLPLHLIQFLPLDDEEAFGSMLLSIHLRGIDPSKLLTSSVSSTIEEAEEEEEIQTPIVQLINTPAPVPISIAPAGRRRSFASNSYGSIGRTQVSTTEFTFSLSLAEGLERLYRSWFEVIHPSSTSTANFSHSTSTTNKFDIEAEVIQQSTSSSSSSTNNSSRVIKKTCPQTLFPSGSCALLEARIQCYQSTPSRAINSILSYPYGSPNELDQPKLFEFFYTDLILEVGKLVVSVEEGLQAVQNRSSSHLVVGRGNLWLLQSILPPYQIIFILFLFNKSAW